MKKLLPLVIILSTAFSFTARAQKGGVAVLDIDEVARVLNVDDALLLDLKGLEKTLNTQLSQYRQNMQSQMNNAEVQAGQQRSEEVQQQLLNFNRKLNRDFGTLKTQASQKLTMARITKINEFRKKLEPIAQEAAKAVGLEVVLTKTPQVFVFTESVDITKDVIERAKAAGLEAKVEVQIPSETEAPAAPAPAETAPDPASSTPAAAPVAVPVAKPTTGPAAPAEAKPKAENPQ